ncbi:MAG: GntR family transcriptional regulator [Streptosporangiaceae bacterium]|jgi:GntR family transcriptional regulator
MAEQPLYRQIAEDLRQKIESGAVARGSQLPTELELREQHNASRNTIRDAVKWLITRGLVETRPGQGTFVVEKIDPYVTELSSGSGGGESAVYESEVAAQSRTPRTTVPRVEVQQAWGVIAAELGLAEGSMVVSRHQQRFIDDRLWSLQTSFYPMRFLEQGATRLIRAENMQPGAVKYIADTLGVEEVGYRDTITVRSPDMNETTLFGLPSDGRVAVVEIFRTGLDDHGKPIRLTATVFTADRNKFVIRSQAPTTVADSATPGLRAVGSDND